jgi:heme oxygenase-like protein
MNQERATMSELTFARSLGYATTVEHTYTSDHTSVREMTNFFRLRYEKYSIFDKFGAQVRAGPVLSRVVASQWYEFSKFIPSFICRAASKVSNNEIRHYVIQTAFEELGMRDVTQIHCELFRRAVEQIGTNVGRGDLSTYKPTHELLSWAWQRLENYTNDAAVLGILLGFEAPAQENISLLFTSIAYDEGTRRALENELFFKIHFAVEEARKSMCA